MSMFLNLLRKVDKRNLIPQLDDTLGRLTQAIHRHQEGGEMTIKIKIKPYSRGFKKDPEDADPVAITVDYTSKIPKAPIASLAQWTDECGLLLDDNPNQLDLPGVQVMDKPASEARLEDEDGPTVEDVATGKETVDKKNFA